MIFRLDPPRRFGAHKVAILCEQRIESSNWGAAMLSFQASKIPVAVLIAMDTDLRAYDLTGRPLDLGVLEAACPGLVQAMTGEDRS